jgi:hypothetical protein
MASEPDKKKSAKDSKPEVVVSIAQHPRAKAGIRRARTRGALIVFALVFVLNHLSGQELFDTLWRALLAGVVANVVIWGFAIVIWRHIVLAEVRELEAEHEEKLRLQREEREERERRRAEEERARAI